MNTWEKYAACRGSGPELWYPEGYQRPADRAQVKEAQRICFGECPVQTECLRNATSVETGSGIYARHGIWGGLTPDQREAFVRATTREERKAIVLRAAKNAGFLILDVAA